MTTHTHAHGMLEVLNPDDWKVGLRFALKTLNTNTVKRAKVPLGVLLVCLQHNLRRGNERHRHRRHIDPTRSAANAVLVGSADPDVADELARNALEDLGIAPARADSIMGVEMVFQPPPEWDRPEFYDVCLRWVKGRYAFVVSAAVHRDQKRPHMHVIVLAIADGRLCGAELSSGENRLQAQRSDFMRHMRATLNLRPDRTAKQVPKSMASIFTNAGKGPKTSAAAQRRDDELARRAEERAADLLAHQPPSPSTSWPEQPHSPADLMAPTSYCAALSTANRLFSDGVAASLFAPAPTRPIAPAPRAHGMSANPAGAARHLRLVPLRNEFAGVAEAPRAVSTTRGTKCRPFVIPKELGSAFTPETSEAKSSEPARSTA